MDMSTAFGLEVKRHRPQAEVPYEPLHVVARHGREVIDRIRVDQANLLRDDKPPRKVIKRMAYGFRDADHFFLKIEAAFPGKAR